MKTKSMYLEIWDLFRVYLYLLGKNKKNRIIKKKKGNTNFCSLLVVVDFLFVYKKGKRTKKKFSNFIIFLMSIL